MKALLLFVLLSSACCVHAEAMPAWLFEPLPIAEQSDENVQALMQRGASLVTSDPLAARTPFVSALKRVKSGAQISEYDYLWAYQGLMASCYDADNVLNRCTRDTYIKIGRRALTHLEEHSEVGQWVFTPEGAALLAFYRTIGNNLAWVLHEGPEADAASLGEALRIIERAESYIGATDDYFVLDTKARILLRMGRQDDAYALIRKVLEEVPDFQWFQEFHEDEEYQAWLARRND